MSRPLRTPLKSAAGLGAAKDGPGHFIAQRVTAIALLFLVPWFLTSIIISYRQGYEGATAWLAQPFNAIAMLLLVSVAFFHMRLGLQTVIEDYIAKHGSRIALLILNSFIVVALWVAAVFSILKVALAG